MRSGHPLHPPPRTLPPPRCAAALNLVEALPTYDASAHSQPDSHPGTGRPRICGPRRDEGMCLAPCPPPARANAPNPSPPSVRPPPVGSGLACWWAMLAGPPRRPAPLKGETAWRRRRDAPRRCAAAANPHPRAEAKGNGGVGSDARSTLPPTPSNPHPNTTTTTTTTACPPSYTHQSTPTDSLPPVRHDPRLQLCPPILPRRPPITNSHGAAHHPSRGRARHRPHPARRPLCSVRRRPRGGHGGPASGASRPTPRRALFVPHHNRLERRLLLCPPGRCRRVVRRRAGGPGRSASRTAAVTRPSPSGGRARQKRRPLPAAPVVSTAYRGRPPRRRPRRPPPPRRRRRPCRSPPLHRSHHRPPLVAAAAAISA